jgi:hypothetical protein
MKASGLDGLALEGAQEGVNVKPTWNIERRASEQRFAWRFLR